MLVFGVGSVIVTVVEEDVEMGVLSVRSRFGTSDEQLEICCKMP